MIINKENLKKFRQDFNEFIKDFAEKNNCSIRLGNISFEEHSFTAKLEVESNSVSKEERGRADFERACSLFGFEKDDYYQIFKDRKGREYRLVGFNLRASKNTIRIKDVKTGDEYSAPEGYLLPNVKA